MENIAHGTDAFGLIFDDLLRFDLRTTRRLTNLYALLYRSLMISDSWAFSNPAFQAMLTDRDGIELLRGGVIVPVRRDKFGSFAEFLTAQRAAPKPIAGLCATPEFAELLDRESPRVITFPLAKIGAAYTAMAERVLSEEILVRLGVSEASAATVAQMLVKAKKENVDWRNNTWIYKVVLPQLSEGDRDRVMEVARAPYALNLPTNILRSGIVGPDGFRGDQILAALQGQQRTVASVGAVPAGHVVDLAFHAGVGDALVNWLLSNEVLEELTAEDLALARSTSNRLLYLAELTAFLASPDQATWQGLVVALEKYLQVAAQEIFDAWRRTGRMQVDPVDGQIVVEGSTVIRIVRPDRPVELSGVAAQGVEPQETRLEVQPMQVIGRTLVVPAGSGEEASV